MGDAVRDGDVHASDPEDTIDAAEPRAAPVVAADPVEVVAAVRDYPQLPQVERQHYAITRELARGGIGRVFEARDLRLGRQVAIKELLPANRDAARRFEREARITARLQHPAIIHVYEAGTWPGGEPFYAMPLVPGRSLDKVVAERDTLAARLGLLPNVIAAVDALAYAHNANVIHRDLKPANVLVGEFGETVVIDWGLAKDLGACSDPKESMQLRLRAGADETLSGGVVGTPAYMPPEQARGDAVDQRADVYALGALLYKVLCGAAPYTGNSSREVIDQVKAGPPVPVHEREQAAPPDLVAIVAKAMSRDPSDRYSTANELAQDLKRFATGQLVGAHRYTARELVWRWLRRHRVAVAIAGIALLALALLGAFTVSSIVAEKHNADRARDLATEARDSANARRVNLLEERGRSELLASNASHALAYLVGAAEDGKVGGARGFMIADAMRPFQAERAYIDLGPGDVVVAASADGRHVAIAGNGPIELRAPDGKLQRALGSHGVTRVVAFDAASTQLVAAGDDGVARVWAVGGGSPIELRAHAGRIRDAAFSRDGTLLATAGDDATVRIWNLRTRRANVVQCHGAAVVSVRFSPAGDKLLSASADFSACVFRHDDTHPDPWKIERQIRGHTAAVNSAEWSADGKFIVTASDDGSARVWSEAWGKPAYREGLHHDPGSVVERALISSSGKVISVGSDRDIRIWQLPAKVPDDGSTPPSIAPPHRLTGHTGRIVSAALSADGRYLLTGGLDGLAKIWDLESRQVVATFNAGDSVTSVAFVPGALRVVTGSSDGTARFWDAETVDRSLDLGYAIRAIAVARDGRVAVAMGDSLVRIVPAGPGKPIDLHGHLGSANAVAFLSDGRLISAGEDAAAIIWDPSNGWHAKPFAENAIDPPPPVQALAVLHDGDRVAVVRDGKVELWSLASGVRVKDIDPPGGRIDTIAVDPQSGAIAGIGRDGTCVVWDRNGQHVQRLNQRDPPSAVAFAPDGSALVTAGAGVAHVWRMSNGVVGVHEITLQGGTPGDLDMGIVRAVLVTGDGSRVITAGDNGRALIWDRFKGKLLGVRDRHEGAINALALEGDLLWVGGEDHMLRAWNVRVESRWPSFLHVFMAEKHVPDELQDDDVVRKRAP